MPPVHTTKLLKGSDTDIVNRICDSLRKAYDPAVAKFFLYRDNGFKDYFNLMINHPEVFIFYTISNITKKILGFAYFEIVDKTLHLRNIIINHDFNSDRIAQSLFFNSINNIKSTHPFLKQFQIETFGKNTGALNWYKKLGMSVKKYLYWYDISHFFLDEKMVKTNGGPSQEVKLECDVFGFTRLLYNDQQIGALIESDYLVIYVILTEDILHLIQNLFGSGKPASACLISNTKLDLHLIDKSVKLSVDLEKIKMI